MPKRPRLSQPVVMSTDKLVGGEIGDNKGDKDDTKLLV